MSNPLDIWPPITGTGGPPSGAAGGDLSGTYPNPQVVGLKESGGTDMPIGPIAAGQVLGRVGGAIVGVSGVPSVPSGPAGGDLAGTYPNPQVAAIHETSGPTKLTVGAIANGELLARVGATIVGVPVPPSTPTGPAGGQLSGTYPDPNVVGFIAAGPTALGYGAIDDGQLLQRIGSNVVGFSLYNPAQIDLYLSDATGNDANNGLTELTAVKTRARLDELLTFVLVVDAPILIHVASGIYDMESGYMFRERMIRSGHIRVFADEDWDPTVFSEIVTGVAGAGTNGVLTKLATDEAANSLRGKWLRFLDGDAAGQWRTIQGNTSSESGSLVTPCDAFGYWGGLTPAPGDTYQICEANVVFSGSTYFLNTIIAGSTSNGGYRGAPGMSLTYPAWQLEGIGFDCGLLVWPTNVVGWGVSVTGSVEVRGGLVYYGNGSGIAPYGTNDLGHAWGLTVTDDLYSGTGAAVYGTVVVSGQCQASGAIQSGHVENVLLASDAVYGPARLTFGGSATIIATANEITVRKGCFLEATQLRFLTSSNPKLTVQTGGQVLLSFADFVTGQSSGSTTVKVETGGQIFVQRETPGLGDAAVDDWDIGDGAPFNKNDIVAGFARFYLGRLVEREP